MGIHNLFGDLKNDRVARKLFKFKQGRLLDAEKLGPLSRLDHMLIIDKGACTGYTMMWCREQFGTASPAFAFSRDGDYTGSFPGGQRGVAQLGVRLQGYLRENNAAGRDGVVAAGRSVGLQVGFLGHFEEISEAMAEDTPLALVSINMIQRNSLGQEQIVAHAIGVNRCAEGLIVFDSNCGEYLVFDEMLFLLFLETCYQKLGMERFVGCDLYAVSK